MIGQLELGQCVVLVVSHLVMTLKSSVDGAFLLCLKRVVHLNPPYRVNREEKIEAKVN